ncbi:AraC family transcriptional regulator [Roseivirga sp. E12]|uniref:helix-turn-helix domain-containing protein n=1 Tax=Roseivirga sp. E12 TaxID=2819237 RepID=UPI001ABD3ED1|nr:helix-turn-helix domain-containing protein [Roseivirga sp. E12]MBO3699043.1 AraC family transcriptional regulator [Roseivirga sp. E12]
MSKKSIATKDIILLFWFFIFSIHLSLIILTGFNNTTAILVLAKSLTLLHGPFFLLYTYTVFGQFKRQLLIHFITFLLFFIVGLFVSNSLVAQRLESVMTITKVLTLIGYPLFILFWTKGNLQGVKNKRADNFILDLRWINSLALLMMTYALLGILHVLAELLFMMQFSNTLDLGIYTLMISVIGFLGLKFGRLYTPEVQTMPPPSKPYKNSPLSKVQIREIRRKIDVYFEESDDFLNPDFKLSELSKKVDAPKHHLSEVINLEMGTTFYDIINAKRIQFATQRMLDKSDTHISLEGLGYECGFNTKSAFYHHFKNFTGKTPGQFKSEIRPD